MPRRSTGCRNCVRRRILCDEGQPSCRNCQTKKIRCDASHDGPQIIFMSMKASAEKLVSRSSRSQVANQANTDKDSLLPSQTESNIPISLGWSHYYSDTRFCYLMQEVAGEDRVWLDYCGRRQEKCPIATIAIDALAIVVHTREHSRQVHPYAATAKYTQALIKLRDGLKEVGNNRFDLLAAATAMERYEVLTCTTGRPWMQHLGGISKMVELSGPGVFQQYPFNIILDCNRLRIIHEAYYWRRPTFLRQSLWKSSRHGRSEAEVHFLELDDLYATVAEVAAQITSLTDQKASSHEQRQRVATLVTDLIINLDKWLDKWASLLGLNKSKHANDPADSFYSDKEGLVFADSWDYPDVRAAIGMNMGKAFKLSALQWKHRLECPQGSLGAANENMTEIPQASSLARDICCSLHAHFPKDQPKKVLNPIYLMFTAFTALRTFHRTSRESLWLQSISERVTESTGIELARLWARDYMNEFSA